MFLNKIDHLVYATLDLKAEVDVLEQKLGIRAIMGGAHPGKGTWNALMSLGENVYLEIIGPDPDQMVDGKLPNKFGIDQITESRMSTWVLKSDDPVKLAEDAKKFGIDFGEVQEGSRKQTDGALLTWTLSDPVSDRESGILPFLINWGQSPHPAHSSPKGCELIALRAEHPEVDRIQALLNHLDLKLPLTKGATPKLIATLRTPNGGVELS